jgi:hypothetical protein
MTIHKGNRFILLTGSTIHAMHERGISLSKVTSVMVTEQYDENKQSFSWDNSSHRRKQLLRK